MKYKLTARVAIGEDGQEKEINAIESAGIIKHGLDLLLSISRKCTTITSKGFPLKGKGARI